MVNRRNNVLPDKFFSRHVRPQIANARPHVTVGELEPGTRKGIGKLVGIFKKAPRNFFIRWVHAHRQVGGQHRRCQAFGRVVRMRNGAGTAAVFSSPLLRAGWAFRQFPFKAEQILKIFIGPLRRFGRPGHFQAAGDRVAAPAAAKAVVPAKALRLDAGRLGFFRNMGRRRCAMGFAKGMAAGDQRNGFFVAHRHAGKGFTNVMG